MDVIAENLNIIIIKKLQWTEIVNQTAMIPKSDWSKN